VAYRESELSQRVIVWIASGYGAHLIRGSASASVYVAYLITGISRHRIRWGTEELEFKCTLRVPSLERLQELLELKDRALQEELSNGKDLIRMPTSWFPTERSPLNCWWVKGVSIVSQKRCAVCDRFQTDQVYAAVSSTCQACAKGEAGEASHSFSEMQLGYLMLQSHSIQSSQVSNVAITFQASNDAINVQMVAIDTFLQCAYFVLSL
jgi:hypothetical protein